MHWRHLILRNDLTSYAGNPRFRLCRLSPNKRAERGLRVLQEVGLALNRAKSFFAAQSLLLGALMVLGVAGGSSAQTKAPAARRAATPSQGYSPGKAAALSAQHKFFGPKSQIPVSMLRRALDSKTLAQFKSRAPGDQAVIRQTVLLTKLDPTLQYSYTPPASFSEHPYWTQDEKYIFFDSNRNSDTDPTPRTDGIYNIYKMFPDGSGITQIHSSINNEIEPVVALDGTTIAYVAGGKLTFPNGTDAPVSSGFNLYTYNTSSAGAPVSLTLNNPSGFTFNDVRHPTFNPGGTQIAFQGQLTSGKPYHIFIVNLQTDAITQMTGPAPGVGAAVESSDSSPAWSPDGTLIAFTSNASGFSGIAPMAASALNPANQSVAGDANQYDIWVLNPNPYSPDPTRVTNSTSILGGTLRSSNKNPAWSSLRTDALQIIPTQTTGTGAVISENLLAFASTRANADPNNPYQATAVKPTHDIYFLHTKIAADPKVQNAYTVTTPESVGNAPIKLQTTSPGTTYDPSTPNDPSYQDPSFNFDPYFASNEDYPAWPQYISSYRIAFQSDRANTTQLWASTIIDINAPTILKYDSTIDEIVHVARDSAPNVSVREVTAGETVRFRVRAVDYESGMESVWIQIKDPNSSMQSVDGQEHKVYYVGPGQIDTTIFAINAPNEFDAQAINPTSYQFRAPGSMPTEYLLFTGGIPGTWPGFNQYVPGIDDYYAFSGANHPPDDSASIKGVADDYTNQGGFWLQLWDDGPIDGSPAGHEPTGEIKGDGVFTATWTTPSTLPSDWIIDVIVRDKALNPFATPASTNAAVNWKIYDNIWGFTTQPFSGNNGILYVNDYDCGQKFFSGNFGSFTNSNQFNSPWQGLGLGITPGSFVNSQFYTGVATESWMTELSPALLPTQALNGTTADALINVLTPLGNLAYADGLTQGPGQTVPVTGTYDQWRIICRGPVPQNILNAYNGHVETQPADVLAGSTTPRKVYVAERCVIWHSPYSGDLYVGPGTILDSTVQVQIANFINSGGRLVLNGNDIVWGLTLGGGASNALLSSTFQANYAGDTGGVIINSHTADPPNPNGFLLASGGRGDHPLIMESWYVSMHGYPKPAPVPPDDPPGTGTMYLLTPASGTPGRLWSAPNGISGDQIQWLGTSVLDTSDYDASYSETGSPNLVWQTHTVNAPIIGKSALISFGLESMNPEYYTVQTTIILKNRRAEIMHNIGDWMRTGRIVGNVLNLQGAAPIKGAFVRAISSHARQVGGTNAGQPLVAATAYTLSDGSYVLDGLETTGTYNIDVFKKGYVTSHGQAGVFHGAYQDKEDIFLAIAAPGSMTGIVTLNNTTVPAPGLIVIATDTVTAETYQATTGTDGTYTISNLPVSNYSVTIPVSPTGNLDKLGYATCIPSSYGPAPAPKPQVTITSGNQTSGINFTVTQAPGNVTGTVTSTTSNGNTNNVIPNATVTVTDVSGTNTTGITNASGVYTISGLAPGAYTAVATASGYEASKTTAVTITSVTTVTQNFALNKAVPGSVSGLVSTSAGVPVTGATITVTDAGGNTLATTTSGAPTTLGNYTYNYKVAVPAGATVSVSASESGYTAATPPANPQTVTISEATETKSVNFYLNPLNVFPSGLSLVSAPYEYSGIAGSSVANLLNIPSGDVSSKAFAFINWNTATGAYVNYPNPPADTFHLGKGYFLQDTDTSFSLALTTIGAPAPANTVYNLPLHVGWNLIGDPFAFPINFLNLKVICADGTSQDILTAQSGTNPTLGAALWEYQNSIYQVSYTLDPWRGYWLRVYDNRPASAQGTAPTITLLVDPAAQQNRAVKPAVDSRQAIVNGNSTGQGWILKLNASTGAVNSAPASIGTMRGALNTYDRFKLEAPPAVGTTNVALTVNHADWGKQSGRYAVDLRPAIGNGNSWNMIVTSNAANQSVTVTWPAISTIPAREDLVLVDTDTNTTVNLRTRSSYTIQAGSAGVTRHLTVSSSPAKRVNLEIASLSAVVNQSRGAAAPTTVSVGYNLTADATTMVSVLKNGHVVRHLEQGATRAAGDTQLLWDLKSDQGIGVPSDVYTIEVRAQDASGHVARQVKPLILTR